MKKLWAWIVAAGAFLLGFLVMRDKKWAERAIDNEKDDIQEDLGLAERANEDAKKHDQRAKEIKAEAEKPQGKESTETLLSRWRK